MIEILYAILAFLVAIALLIAVHEYGHYSVARLLNFKVLRFSIGFGKAIWQRKSKGPDGTEYWLAAIPIGGYVKLLDERDGDVADHERHRAFNRRPIPQRIAVLLAGPGFNFLFAIAAYWIFFISGVPGLKPLVGPVEPASPAYEAGLREDDEILSVSGKPVQTWEGTVLALLDAILDGGTIPMRVREPDSGEERNVAIDIAGKETALTEPDALFPGLGFRPVSIDLPPLIGRVEDGSPAALAGMQKGDRIFSADEQPIKTWTDLVLLVRDRPGKTVEVGVERVTGETFLEMTIGSVTERGKTIGRIGVEPDLSTRDELFAKLAAEQTYSPLGALVRATEKTWEMSVLTVKMLGRMVIGDVSIKNLSGPINIASYAGDSAQAGFNAFIRFLALISISLGIINLLPIPILDGGQIVYQLVEAVKGSPLSERALIVGQQVGIFLLLVIMSFAFYNDISRIFAQ